MRDHVPNAVMRRQIEEFERLLKPILEGNCETGLYMQNHHLLGLVVDDLEWFGCLEILNESLFEMFTVRVKRVYRATSQQLSLGIEIPVSVMETRSKGCLKRTYSMRNVELSMKDGKAIYIEWTGVSWFKRRRGI